MFAMENMAVKEVSDLFPIHSTEIKSISAALAKAQGSYGPIEKTRTATVKGATYEYEYHYADLADVLEALRKPLSENELSITQLQRPIDNKTFLVSKLVHSSGQWFAYYYQLTPDINPQKFGSQLTYARRYSVCALVGVMAEEDDDANLTNDTDKGKDKDGKKVTTTSKGKTNDGTAAPKAPPKPTAPKATQSAGTNNVVSLPTAGNEAPTTPDQKIVIGGPYEDRTFKDLFEFDKKIGFAYTKMLSKIADKSTLPGNTREFWEYAMDSGAFATKG